MAGTALASGILTVAATLSLGLSGAIVTDEDPCALAARVALASGATLVACRADGLMATVQVESAYAGLVAVSRARAGQPEG